MSTELEALDGLLGKTVRVAVHSPSWSSEPRTFTGRFWCTDRDANLVLTNATEEHTTTLSSPDGQIVETSRQRRQAGLVLLRGELITSFEVAAQEEAEASGEATPANPVTSSS